jgi:Arc/MetJ-type ribon-helix-helix transcriptional regulator
MIDDVREQGQFKSLSEFLNKAARLYAVRWKKASLKKTLRAGYRARAQRDNKLLDEWEASSTELLWGDSDSNSDQK